MQFVELLLLVTVGCCLVGWMMKLWRSTLLSLAAAAEVFDFCFNEPTVEEFSAASTNHPPSQQQTLERRTVPTCLLSQKVLWELGRRDVCLTENVLVSTVLHALAEVGWCQEFVGSRCASRVVCHLVRRRDCERRF